MSKKNLINILFDLLIVSVFLTPPITIMSSLPKFSLSDLLLPFIFLAIVPHIGKRLWTALKGHLLLVSVFAFVVLLSIAVNNRLWSLQDHFELFKIGKYMVIFAFIYIYYRQVSFWRTVNVVFVLLLLFNLLHYFDVMDFNQYVEIYYGDAIHVKFFGLNSLGQPDTKRLLGTVGNPNNNAILFLFFVVLYFPKSKAEKWRIVFFALAIFTVMFCQSRTGIIALGVVYIAGAFLNHYRWYITLGGFGLIALVFWLQSAAGNTYAYTLVTENMTEHGSLKSRFEIWKMLWEMIKQKPILGYAPHKDFFYDNHLYAESGYVLFTWRYGFIGLLLTLAWILQGVYLGFKKRSHQYGMALLLFSVVVGLTSITNSPFADPSIFIMIAILFGLYYTIDQPLLQEHE